MMAASRGGQALSALFNAHTRTACAQCAQSRAGPSLIALARRPYSAAAATAAAQAPSSSSSTSSSATAVPAPSYRIRAGLLLSRPPLLTKDPTPFEAAFYLYQKRLEERLAGPFSKNVYFKPDTTPALDWKLQLRARRGTPARDIGFYEGGKGSRGAAGGRAWDDEITVDDPLAEELTHPDKLRERIISDADMRVSEDGEKLAESDRVRVDRPQPRKTAADAANDTRRLDRAMDRTLYLVVKESESSSWVFPTADVETSEALHDTAARALKLAAGVDMNTWIVGRVPIAHFVRNGEAAEEVKTFFLKGRIMAGQANLEGNKLGLTDFKWLTKEELAKELPRDYYTAVKNSMPSR